MNATPHELLAEDLLTLAAAARLFPGSRGAARVNPSTVFRWCCKGTRTPAGVVKLEHLRVGGRLLTSRQAVERFVTALSAPAERPVTPIVRTPAARRKASEAAAEALKRAGA